MRGGASLLRGGFGRVGWQTVRRWTNEESSGEQHASRVAHRLNYAFERAEFHEATLSLSELGVKGAYAPAEKLFYGWVRSQRDRGYPAQPTLSLSRGVFVF